MKSSQIRPEQPTLKKSCDPVPAENGINNAR
jgi:hypothetical protein